MKLILLRHVEPDYSLSFSLTSHTVAYLKLILIKTLSGVDGFNIFTVAHKDIFIVVTI
jgi:hypothetical protein